MKAAASAMGMAIVLAAATPCRADPPLAGQFLVASSPGQPFCASRRELAAYVLATIQHDNFPPGTFKGCVVVSKGTPVTVFEDLGPHGPYFHMVRARATFSFPFGSVDAYTYSVGLYRVY